MNTAISIIIYGLHILILPLLVLGIIRKGKARLQNRIGPSIWQPFYDVAKLMRKSETISETSTLLFRIAPIVSLAAVFTVSMMVPWLGAKSPITGDLFIVIYLFALGKFLTNVMALDTGSAFGAIGASRESTISLQTEPVLLLVLGAYAVHAKSSSLDLILSHHNSSLLFLVIGIIAAVALWLALMADMSRMPIDDPTTHLELTMVHEAMILENSGRNLALVEYASALKMVVVIGLIGRILLLAASPLSAAMLYLYNIGIIAMGALVIIVSESVLVKLRWRRVPNLLSFAVSASIIVCLLIALKG